MEGEAVTKKTSEPMLVVEVTDLDDGLLSEGTEDASGAKSLP